MHRSTFALLLGLAAPSAAAQLPSRHLAIGAIPSGNMPGGIYQLDPTTGVPTAVTGAFSPNVNCLAFDRYSGEYIVGGAGTGQIRALRLGGATVISERTVTTLPAAGVSALVLDGNGDYLASVNAGTSFDVYRIARRTGAATVLNAVPFAGILNALCAGNGVYVAELGANNTIPSRIHRILSDGSVQLLCTTAGVISGSQFVSGLAFGPDGKDLWVAAFGTPSLCKVQLEPTDPAQPLVLAPVLSTLPPLNALEYDPSTQKLYTCAADVSSRLYQIDPISATPTATQIASFPSAWGVTAGITINDFPEELTVFPQVMDSAAGPQDLELAMHGNPGDVGVVVISAANGLPLFMVLGAGLCGADGRVTIPPLTLPIQSSWAGTVIEMGYASIPLTAADPEIKLDGGAVVIKAAEKPDPGKLDDADKKKKSDTASFTIGAGKDIKLEYTAGRPFQVRTCTWQGPMLGWQWSAWGPERDKDNPVWRVANPANAVTNIVVEMKMVADPAKVGKNETKYTWIVR